MNEAQVLAPGRDVQVGDETVRVEPIRGLRRTIEAAAKISPVLKKLSSAGQLFPSAQKALAQPASPEDVVVKRDLRPEEILGIVGAWVDLLAVGGDDVLCFLAFALSKPPEWLDEREVDEVIALARAVYEENRDFFGQRLGILLPVPEVPGAPENPAPELGPTSSES